MPVKTRPAVERVLNRCVEDENGCWVFQGALSVGYGKVGLGSKAEGIDFCHRVTYRALIGEIPSGLDLDHLCRNRACCNPWHLDPVTRHVNANRGLRAFGYRLPQCKNGHDYTPENTRTDTAGYRRCLTCLRANDRTSSATYRARSAA